jgi:hypothetical protein
MQVVLPQVDAQGNAVTVQPADAEGSLAEMLKRNETKTLLEMKNREPKWNPGSQMYQLDFHGRATLASCKNIQLHSKVRQGTWGWARVPPRPPLIGLPSYASVRPHVP